MMITSLSSQRLFLLLLSHHFFSQRYIPLSCGQMFELRRDNGEVVDPSIKINIYKMLCVNNQYRNQEGEKRKLTRLRVAFCEAH